MTGTFTVAFSNASDATFRAWVAAMFAAFEACGWVRVAQSGDIADPATLVVPAISTVGGFRVYRMNDALQPTTPCFVKVEVGTGTASTSPQFWITVAGGVDGSGGMLLGGTRQGFTNALAASSISYYSGATNRIVLALWTNISTAVSKLVSIERTHGADGADTARGLMVYLNYGSGSHDQYILLGNGVSVDSKAGSGSFWTSFPNSVNSSSFGVGVGFFGPLFRLGGIIPATMNLALVGNQDFAQGGEFQHAVNGVLINWLPLNTNVNSPTGARWLIRYD